MQNQTDNSQTGDRFVASANMALLVLTGSMLLVMVTRTEPHPALEFEIFALGPYLATSLAIGSAAYVLAARGAPDAMAITFVFALTALVSYGSQKHVDAEISRTWPEVVVAQIAITVIMCPAMCREIHLMRPQNKAPML